MAFLAAVPFWTGLAAAASAASAGVGIASAMGAFGGKDKQQQQTQTQIPQITAPKAEVSQEEARKDEIKRRARVTRTLLTTPQGVLGEAATGKKTLLGG